MRQRPVYVLNHSQHNFRQRTTQADLDEIEDWTDRAARRMYEGAGLSGPRTSISSILTTAIRSGRSSSWRPSSGTASNAATPSTPAISGSRDRARSLRAAAIWGTAAPVRDLHRQHRAAPRHRRRTASRCLGRDCAGGLYHAKQRRLDHVRQITEPTPVTL